MKIKIPSVVKIALGNLWEHKSKTLILGLLIMIGVAIIVLGNGFLESSKTNLQRDLTANYTGDILIHGPYSETGTVSLFGVTSTVNVGSLPVLPAIADINQVYDVLNEYDAKTKSIKNMTPCISSNIILSTENIPEDFEEDLEASLTFSVISILAGPEKDYYEVFSDIKVLEGSVPSDKEYGILVEDAVRQKFEKYYKISLNIGDKVLLTDLSGSDIREVRVTGFYKQPNEDSPVTALCYVDPTTARTFAQLTYGSVFAEELPEVVDLSISSFSEDELFGDLSEDMFQISEDFTMENTLSDRDYDSILGDTSLRDKLNETDDGAWNFMVVKLKDSNEAPKIIEDLNKIFTEGKIACTAIPWDQAGLAYTTVNGLLNGVFTSMVFLLVVVVFIVIMNTLVVSVIERTSEIGTMKALGASRSFIRKLFFVEAVSVSLIASVLGVILDLVLSGILNASNITIADENVKIFLGGGNIGFIPTLSSILGTLFAIILGSSLANIYPVSLALRVTPLKAMNQE